MKVISLCAGPVAALVVLLSAGAGLVRAEKPVEAARESAPPAHLERPDDSYQPGSPRGSAKVAAPRAPAGSVQVNVDGSGMNILGDAANEPSIAIDPNDRNRMVIGWRQFNTIASNFRQAGWAWSSDGGQTWTFPGVLQPGVFRSDPVLGSDG